MRNASRQEWNGRRRWLFWTAFVTAALTFVLLLSGGQVTSYDVGMAVPDWPTTFGENMFAYSWLNESLGVFVEHRHRLIGATVGVFAIFLAASYWVMDRRGGRPWLATMALAFIVIQGVLGGHRVTLNSMGIGRELAICHGLFAQICFATLIAVVVVSSRRWLQAEGKSHHLARLLQATLAGAWLYLPVMMTFGAVQRHLGAGIIPHLALAGVWLLFVLWLTVIVYLDAELRSSLGAWPAILTALTLTQLGLGLGAIWATRLLPPGAGKTPSTLEAALPTLHLAVGALLFATTTVLALLAHRLLVVSPRQAAAEGYGLEGAR